MHNRQSLYSLHHYFLLTFTSIYMFCFFISFKLMHLTISGIMFDKSEGIFVVDSTINS